MEKELYKTIESLGFKLREDFFNFREMFEYYLLENYSIFNMVYINFWENNLIIGAEVVLNGKVYKSKKVINPYCLRTIAMNTSYEDIIKNTIEELKYEMIENFKRL